MNLKKVKMVHETPAHFIMHDGQTHFHIAKKGLDKEIIGRIKGFSEGGEAEKEEDPYKKAGEDISKSVPPAKSDAMKKAFSFSEGGEVYGKDKSGEPNQNSDPDMEKQALQLNTVNEDHIIREFAEKAMHYAESSPENQPVGEAIGSVPTQPVSEPVTLDISGKEPVVVSSGAPVPKEQQVSMAPQQPQQQPQAQYEQPAGPTDIAPAPQSLEESEKLQMGGIRETARIEAEAAAKTADALDAHNRAMQARQNQLDQAFANIDKETAQLAESAKKDIDPNRYWANQSMGSKLSAAIGLILGGASSGLTGQANPAEAFIKNAINQDIEAQKADQSNRMNLYKMGLQKYHDTQAAHTYAMLGANTLLSSKLQQIAESSQNPLIKRRAEILMGKTFEARLPLQADLAQRSLMLEASGGNNAIANPMGLTEENRKLMVPAPGGGFTPALSEKDAEKIKQVNPVFEEVKSSIKEMMKDQEDMGRGILPYGEVKKRAEVKRNNILSLMSQLEGLNRLTDNELKLFKDMVPSSADILQGASRGKMEELQSIVNNKQRLLYKTHTPAGNKMMPQITTVPPRIK